MAVAVVGARPANDAPSDEGLVVKKEPLVKEKIFTGELKALRSQTIRAPAVSSLWNFTITYMVPEGSRVSPGDVVARFDAGDLEIRRLDKEKQREEARIEIAKKQADIETRLQDLLVEKARAKKDLLIAELEASIPADLLSRSKLEESRFNYEKAKLDLGKAEERLASLRESAQAEMAVARLGFEQADLELKRIEADLEKMEARAPAKGIVIYEEDWSTERKFQVGDTIRKSRELMRLPDLDQFIVEARVHHADVVGLRMNTPVEVVLDAFPERSYKGHVDSLPETAQKRTWRSQFKFFKMKIRLDEMDAALMKPGMTARVLMPVERPESLLVPRRALRIEPSGDSYVELRDQAGTRVPVEIVDASAEWAAVEGDLRDGQLLKGPSEEEESRDGEKIEWLPVERKDLEFKISGTGLLRAGTSVAIKPPALANTWTFKIARMAPEGIEVEKGDFLVQFDPSELMQRLRDERSSLAKVRKEIEKSRHSSQLKIKDLALQLEQARVSLEKAETKLVQAREFESNREVKKARFELDFARFKVEALEKKLASQRQSAELQMSTLSDKQQFYEARVANTRKSVDALTINAPIAGVLVYRPNWSNEKKQVGDQVYASWSFLGIPDLDTLRIEGQISEVDAGKLEKGLPAKVTLDALAEETFPGEIVEVGTIFRRAVWDQDAKVLDVIVELENVDTERMRPGMAARLEVIVDRFEKVIAVPLSVLQVEGGGSASLWVREGERAVKREVKLGRDNGIVAIIESGLEEGEQIASRPQS